MILNAILNKSLLKKISFNSSKKKKGCVSYVGFGEKRDSWDNPPRRNVGIFRRVFESGRKKVLALLRAFVLVLTWIPMGKQAT